MLWCYSKIARPSWPSRGGAWFAKEMEAAKAIPTSPWFVGLTMQGMQQARRGDNGLSKAMRQCRGDPWTSGGARVVQYEKAATRAAGGRVSASFQGHPRGQKVLLLTSRCGDLTGQEGGRQQVRASMYNNSRRRSGYAKGQSGFAASPSSESRCAFLDYLLAPLECSQPSGSALRRTSR